MMAIRPSLKSMIAGAILCSLAGSLASAAPTVSSVSGTLSSGQTVTISGSGFGSKPQAQPVLWDDFEGGVSGQLVTGQAAKAGRWDSGTGSDMVTYSTTKPRTGKQSAFHNFMSTQNASLAKNMTFDRLYMDFWMLVEYSGNKSRNFKPWRFYGDSDRLQLDYVWLCNGQLTNRVQENAGWSQGDWGGDTYKNNTWMHVQLIYSQSSPGVANGTIRHYVDSKKHGLDSGAIVTQMKAAQFDQIRIGHYWAKDGISDCPSNPGSRVYVDDVYIDTSWARVELGNASTYAASTQREIQVPSSWADGKISVKFNPGKFSSGSTAYLYVTDANNNTSPGIAIKIGDAATEVKPNPPTSVQVE